MSTITSLYRKSTLVFFTPLLLLSICAGFSIGLTFAPCYSSVCVETYFPRETRYHIGLYYCLLVSVTMFFYTRRLHFLRRILEHYLPINPIPLVGARISVGGLLLCVWICGLTFGSTGYWYPGENRYWMARGSLVNWTDYMFRIIWTGVTGHWCDIWIGLVVIPVGRNSILTRLFHIQPSTLLQAHKIIAIGLLIFSLIHGFLYYSFLAAWANVNTNRAIEQQFNPDNPLLTWPEGKAKGIYTWFVLPTGAIAGLFIIPAMVITALPIIRRTNYNLFYFFHVVAAVVLMVVVCLHASTNFYFILPGLTLWISDWVWRLLHSLGTTVDATVENAGNGWYRVRVTGNCITGNSEAALEKGGESMSPDPLATYYLNFIDISRLQGHPFTAIDGATANPAFLFRKSPERKTPKKRDNEWTWKLAALADTKPVGPRIQLRSRIEGPYSPRVSELFLADHILLLVGGTGITGALAIAQWWTSNFGGALASSKSLHLVWTVRNREISRLSEVDELHSVAKDIPNLTLAVHFSSEEGRLLPEIEIGRFISSRKPHGDQCWVYVSGPAGLLQSAETACIEYRNSSNSKMNGVNRARLDWHIAHYET